MGEENRLWVLGTGTGVGKTYVSARLLEALRARGQRTLGLKPVESGVEAGDDDANWAASDAGQLAAASGRPARPLYALRAPVSPHLAARTEGREIEVEPIARWLDEATTEPLDLVLIETAGGVFSPLSSSSSNFELARACARPGDRWLLLAPDRLGVLHELSACLLAMQALGRLPDAIALSQPRPVDASSGQNLAEFQNVVLPRLGLARAPELLGVLRADAKDCDAFVSWWSGTGVAQAEARTP